MRLIHNGYARELYNSGVHLYKNSFTNNSLRTDKTEANVSFVHTTDSEASVNNVCRD
jgi:hypothetical protein